MKNNFEFYVNDVLTQAVSDYFEKRGEFLFCSFDMVDWVKALDAYVNGIMVDPEFYQKQFVIFFKQAVERNETTSFKMNAQQRDLLHSAICWAAKQFEFNFDRKTMIND